MERCRTASSSKTERKVIERNRRNQMKTLYSKLYSLLPTQPSQETMSVPDQIDEAIRYVKGLQVKLEKLNQKKESSIKKRRSSAIKFDDNATSIRLPEIKVHEMGHSLEVVFTSGLGDRSIFYEIIGLLHQDESIDIVSASSSAAGSSLFHVIHAEMKASEMCSGFGAARVSKRLNECVRIS